ncbi:MAG: hypothetical protein IJE97_02395 [Thermoguttaceae bacterium]|nr:hypothetical protein [Thermoguttaceae bacterium]
MASENSGCVGFFTAVGALLTAVWVGFQVYDEVKNKLPSENLAVVRADGDSSEFKKETTLVEPGLDETTSAVETTLTDETNSIETYSGSSEVVPEVEATSTKVVDKPMATGKEKSTKKSDKTKKETEEKTAEGATEETEEPVKETKKGFYWWESTWSRCAFTMLLPLTTIIGIAYVGYVGITCGQASAMFVLLLHIFVGVGAGALVMNGTDDPLDGGVKITWGLILYVISTFIALIFVW